MLVDGDVISLELALLSGNGCRGRFFGVAVRCPGASAVRNRRDDGLDNDGILLRLVGFRFAQCLHIENFLRFQTRCGVVDRSAEHRQATDDLLGGLRAQRGDGGVQMIPNRVDGDVTDRSNGTCDGLVSVVGVDAVGDHWKGIFVRF